MSDAQQLKIKPFTYFIGIVAALAGLLFGMDTGVIAGALPFIQNQYHLPQSTVGWIVSILTIGAVAGTFLSMPISRHLGRRSAIIISAILFTVGAIASAMTPNVEILIMFRFVLGIALGIAAYTTPLYLAEISPERIRGSMISIYQLMITIGLASAFIADKFLAIHGNWRMMLGIVAIPSLLMLLMLVVLPRSPRWLLLTKRSKEARDVLKKVLYSEQVNNAYTTMEKNLKTHSGRASKAIWNKFWLVLLLGLGLQMLQQWTGINVIMYYAPAVFKGAGFSSINQQMWCAVFVGLINVLSTLVAVILVDRMGRKPLLYIGLTVMMLSLLAAAVLTHMPHTKIVQYGAVAAVLTYVFGFAISLGPIAWIICAEIFPLRVRDYGIMLTMAANWTYNSALGAAFPRLLPHLGLSAIFSIFSGMCLVGLIFTRLFVPETKNIGLETIESNLMSGKRLRKLGV
jgi:MFS transporter, SP family, galactose:H+ symporter